jgi:hypothetical protein
MAAVAHQAEARFSSGVLEHRLARLWVRQIRGLVLRGGAFLAAALGAMVLLDLLLDWGLDLSGPLRLVLLAANLAALGVIAHRTVARQVRRYDAVDQALAVERALGGLNGLIVSGVQFAGEAQFPAEVSRGLMRAVRRHAEQRTAEPDMVKASPKVPLGAALGCALAAVLALSATGAWKGQYLWVWACRMVNPSSALAYPTDTTIEVTSGDVVLRHGEPLTLFCAAAGVVPPEGKVHVRFQGLGWEAVAVTAGPDGQFAYGLPRVTENLEYYFRIGDARSPRQTVTVVRPPRIVAASVELGYPEYTRLQPQKVDTLNLKAPEGTRLAWTLKFDRPVTAAEMVHEGAGAQALNLSPDGRGATVQLRAEASYPYSINLRWKLKRSEFVEPGARHYIQVIPDADPQVGLLRPAEDTKATLKKTVMLSYWARDDYGLGEAWIVYSLNDGGERRLRFSPLGGLTNVERESAWPITQALAGLKEKDIVTFAVEVSDGRPGEAGKGRSISRRVQFVSDGDYVAYVLARQRKFLGQLRPLYLQEKEAARSLEAAGTPAPATAPAAGRNP